MQSWETIVLSCLLRSRIGNLPMDDMQEKDNAPSGSNFKGGVYAGVATG
jgi:hypothetical protein